MKAKVKKEKEMLCGRVLTDFVNAKTTDEAILQYLDNVSSLLRLSSKSVAFAKNKIPLISNYGLNSQEFDLIKLMSKKDRLLEAMQKYELVFNERIKGYDGRKKAFTLKSVELIHNEENLNSYSDPTEEVVEIGETFERNVTHISRMFESIEKTSPNEYSKEFTTIINDLIKTGDEIEVLRGLISDSRYSEISKIDYKEICDVHIHILDTQKNLGILFKDLIRSKKLSKDSKFYAYLLLYNNINKIRLSLDKDGYVIEKPVFHESSFFRNTQGDGLLTKDGLRTGLDNVIAYCVVEYFRSSDNRKLLHICKLCGSYYLSKRIGTSLFCSDRCRLKYHNTKRIESGKAREYKRKKRKEGAKISYY